MTDNWKHRSVGMVCDTCMFFAVKIPNNPQPASIDSPVSFGRCRRHAPTMNGYPAVFGTDWCGDHKMDENRRLHPVDFDFKPQSVQQGVTQSTVAP